MSQTLKTGAVGSLFMARIGFADRTPTMWLNDYRRADLDNPSGPRLEP